MSFSDAVTPWHEFFALTGSASATLIGLLFVAVSVGAGVFSRERYAGLRAFVSPSLVVFASVLAASLMTMIPTARWHVAGLLFAADGVFGMIYACFVGWSIVARGFISKIDWEDRTWYAAAPVVAHGITVVASVLFVRGEPAGCEVLALSMGLLLIIGVRNAWDMTVWSVTRERK